MAHSTDNDFNATSRTIMVKIALYLDGESSNPLEITRDNYLVSLSLLEEATAGDTIFDNVSSNELTIVLQNPNGIFSPTNTSSPYYGKMKRDTLVQVFIRAHTTDDWYLFNTSYVSNWYASVTGLTATIITDDILYKIFGNTAVALKPHTQETVTAFYTRYFAEFDIVPVVDALLTQTLPITYVSGDNKQFISALSTALLAICNVAHNGNVTITGLHRAHTLRATFTDANQVIGIDAELSIIADYDAAQLTYQVPHISDAETVLDISEVLLKPGVNTATYKLEKTPLHRLTTVSFANTSSACGLTSAECDSQNITLVMRNPQLTNIYTKLNVSGQYVATVDYTLGDDDGANTLKVTNPYIQTVEQATDYYDVMEDFTQSNIPVLQVTVRGNPLIEIGDKIKVTSTKYNVDFTGFVMRQQFKYDGGLSCTMTLLNASLMEVSA